MNFQSIRAKAGFARQIYQQAESYWVAIGGGQSVNEDDIFQSISNSVIERYQVRIREKLSELGLDIPHGEPLTVETLLSEVRKKTGLEIATLDREGLMAAIDKRAAAELSRSLGIEVTTVFDLDALDAQVMAALVEALQEGGKAKFLKGRDLERIRAAATYLRSGLSPDEVRAAKNRYYQRRYRRNNKKSWQ
jgi:hypothetical protein